MYRTCLFVVRHFAGEFNQSLHAESGCAVFSVFPGLGYEGRTSDIPVAPCSVFGHEFLQEEGGRNCACVASRILEVGKLVLEGIGVFFFQRHAPELFAAGFAAVDHLQAQVVIVAEESGDCVTESADHGARKGGEVHDVGGADEAGFGKSVGENQTAFGVGVVHHDGLAVLGGKNIARQHGLVTDGIFGEAADGAHVNRELECCNSLDGGERGRCTTHVADHFGHGFRRFQAEAAGIKSQTLADNDQVILRGALGGLVFKGDHVRFVGTALTDRHVTHEAFLFKLLHVADLDGEAFGILGDRLGAFYEFGGVEVSGASVDQVLGKRNGLLFHGNIFGNLLEFLDMFAGDDFVGHLEAFFLLALVGVKLVVGVVKTVGDSLELFFGSVGEEQANGCNLFFHGALGQAIGGHTQVVEGREAAFLGGIHKNGVATVDFEVFQVFEGAVIHALQNGFYLFFSFGGKNGGKLDGLLDEKEGVSLVVSILEIFRGNDIQIHALNLDKMDN